MRISFRRFVPAAVGALLLTARLAAAQTIPQPALPLAGEAAPFAPAASRPKAAALAIPSWVRPGLGVTYLAYSAFVQDGRYVDPIEILLATRVASASSRLASAVTRAQTVGTPLVHTYDWSCNDAGQCRGDDFQFWVDPGDAAASILGPEGERFVRAGAGKYTDPWKRTWNATLLTYQNPSTGVRFSVCYQTSTGLILYNVESYPSEYIVEFYYS